MPIETPLLQEHEKAGAKLSVYFDCLLPESFGDPVAEYHFAREGVALLDTNYHSVFRLSGPDRTRYLNAILTNNIQELGPGQWNSSLLLTPQGHILAEIDVLASAGSLCAISHKAVRTRTAQTLEKFIIMDDVELKDATDSFASLSLIGPKSADIIHTLGFSDPFVAATNAYAEATLGGLHVLLVRRQIADLPQFEIFFERKSALELWRLIRAAVSDQGGRPCGYEAWNSLRLEAGIPWFGYDFDDKYIPHEAGLENTHISFSKGCYTGQEIVERVRSHGHVNRLRVGLEFAGREVPESGAVLLANEKELGTVTSAANSYLLGKPIGMGYVRRESASPGTLLQWARGKARVIELPLSTRDSTSADLLPTN